MSAIHIEMVFADEHGGDRLDPHKYTMPDQLVRRHASQAHSVGPTHPTLMHHVFVLLEKRDDGVLMLKAKSFCDIDWYFCFIAGYFIYIEILIHITYLLGGHTIVQNYGMLTNVPISQLECMWILTVIIHVWGHSNRTPWVYLSERKTNRNNMPHVLPLSWHLLWWIIYSPTGPNRFAMRPFGKATDWNFNPCTRLWPLYTALCISPGRQIGLTVPSTKPTQLSRAAPSENTTSA